MRFFSPSNGKFSIPLNLRGRPLFIVAKKEDEMIVKQEA